MLYKKIESKNKNIKIYITTTQQHNIKQHNNTIMKSSNVLNKRRNKDNIWFMKTLNESQCPTIYKMMFELIDLNQYECIEKELQEDVKNQNQNQNQNQNKNKNKKKRKTNKKSCIKKEVKNIFINATKNNTKMDKYMKNNLKFPIFMLDKFDNLVYVNGLYYGTYEASEQSKCNKLSMHYKIYNNCNEHKYTIYYNDEKFLEVKDIFDQYQSITLKEQNDLMDILDVELSELFDLMDKNKKQNDEKDENEENKKHQNNMITNKLRLIIEKMYNSKIDLTSDSYDKINEYMTNVET